MSQLKTVGPSCALKRASELAAAERKVLFLHDDYSNATENRHQMLELANVLDTHQLVSYFGNSPTRLRNGDTEEEEEEQSYQCLWYAGDEKLIRVVSKPHIDKLAVRKGPFFAIVAVGTACKLAKLIAQAHNCLEINPSELPSSNGTYPVFVASPHQYFELEVSHNANKADCWAPLKLPTKYIEDFIVSASSGAKPTQLFDYPKSNLAALKQQKQEKRRKDKEFSLMRTEENRLRKELKMRKAAGEDVEVPPNVAKILRVERQKLRKEDAAIAVKSKPHIAPTKANIEIIPYTASLQGLPGLVMLSLDEVDNQSRTCNYITNPMAEPVTPCLVSDLEEMIVYLKSNFKIKPNQVRVDFTKGSILNHGGMAVDLCKQVVGPEGIEPILEAVGQNDHVERFLLGNNISGDRGAMAMASFISDKIKSRNIYNFYIAGNEIGPAGAKALAESLHHDSKVTALWLKRNPIGTPGAYEMANMLTLNTTLQTLDLVNTGIMDEGAAAIFNALEKVVDTSAMIHLYIGSNALSQKTAQAASSFLKTGKSKLQTLYFAAGRMGDDGAVLLAEGIAKDSSITRLGISSERIGVRGCKALADALESHPRIMSIDIGLRKGTYVLGERPNKVLDEGAIYLVEKLLGNDRPASTVPLRMLDIAHNNLSENGLNKIIGVVEAQKAQSLLLFNGRQHALKFDTERVKKFIDRNKKQYKLLEAAANKGDESAKKVFDDVQGVMKARHIYDIYSIYRNNM